MIVASEYPFLSIVGVEMSPGLCEIARSNMATLQSRRKLRITPRLVCGDALTFGFPPGSLVVFLCHSFGLPVLKGVLDALDAIPRAGQDIFFVYENPVYGEELDQRKGFERWYARTVPADADELPFHSGVRALGEETVVIWRRCDGPRISSDSEASRKIVVESEGWRVSLS